MGIILEFDILQITCSKESKNMEVEKNLRVTIIFYIKKCLLYALEKRFSAPAVMFEGFLSCFLILYNMI